MRSVGRIAGDPSRTNGNARFSDGSQPLKNLELGAPGDWASACALRCRGLLTARRGGVEVHAEAIVAPSAPAPRRRPRFEGSPLMPTHAPVHRPPVSAHWSFGCRLLAQPLEAAAVPRLATRMIDEVSPLALHVPAMLADPVLRDWRRKASP
ncbi:hypothetical protein GCM10010219_09440 [Streptomyces netropsis]|nr:hypothetical protein GCM10010219_09440 [Streptomyces netropsis]